MNAGFAPFMLLGLLSSVGWVLLIAGAVILIVWAIRSMQANSPRPAVVSPGVAGEAPLDILARRFAKGEITAEEYERARDLLRGEPPAQP